MRKLKGFLALIPLPLMTLILRITRYLFRFCGVLPSIMLVSKLAMVVRACSLPALPPPVKHLGRLGSPPRLSWMVMIYLRWTPLELTRVATTLVFATLPSLVPAIHKSGN